MGSTKPPATKQKHQSYSEPIVMASPSGWMKVEWYHLFVSITTGINKRIEKLKLEKKINNKAAGINRYFDNISGEFTSLTLS